MRQSGFGRIAAPAAIAAVSLLLSTFAIAQPAPAPLPVMPPSLPPTHVVNLMTNEGSAAFGAQWRVTDVRIVEVPAAINKERYKTTYQIEPRAMATEFDDSKWEQVQAKDLGLRRSAGLTAFMWFRASLTIPTRIGNVDLSKPAQAVFNVLVDDYGEVWVNGEMPRRSGYPSPATIQGLNMPNRVVLGTQVKAGDKFQVAVFAANGPLSAPNGSVWFRQAMVEFYQ